MKKNFIMEFLGDIESCWLNTFVLFNSALSFTSLPPGLPLSFATKKLD